MPPTKIVISTNSTWNFINFRQGLLRALVDDGHEVVAVAPDDGHVAEIVALGCRFEAVAMARRGTSPLAEARLQADYFRLLRRERPDAYLSFTIKPNVYGAAACRLLRIPAICNIAGLGTVFLSRGPFNRFVRALYRLALVRAVVVFFQNPQDRAMFVDQRLVRPESARLVPGSGVDLARFAPPPERHERGPPSFLLIARLLWAKGIREYVEAAQRVRAAYPDARFRLLGLPERAAGAIDASVLADWHASGAIEVLAPTDDVRPAIAATDCVVLPTFYPEGTPRALLEAAAMARPLVATDVPGCRDVVEHGVNGFLCVPQDSASLAEAMLAFAALDPDQRRRMGRASRALAEEKFDERIVIAAYRQALADVIGHGEPT